MKATRILVACLSSMVLLSGLQAATNTVTTASDQLDSPAGAELSLREAIRDATSGDTIDFSAGLVGGTLWLLFGYMDIDAKNLTIDASSLGVGDDRITVTASTSRHFWIHNGSIVTLNSLILTDGDSTTQGGSLFVENDSDITVLNCDLLDNQAKFNGGAIHARNSSAVTLFNCIVRGNVAGNVAFSGHGGGIYCIGFSNTLAITRSRIERNRCTDLGGGAYIDGGVAGIPSETFLELTESTVSDNEAAAGGGLYVRRAHLRANRSAVAYNQALNEGGGIFVEEPRGELTTLNVTVAGNRALDGAGIFLEEITNVTLRFTTMAGNTAELRGGGLYSDNADVTLRNCAIASNTARRGGDFFRDGGSLAFTGNHLIGNNQTVEADFSAGTPNGSGDYVGTSVAPLDPRLAPLAPYGGPTPSMIPLENSLLVDNAGATSLALDQRHYPRPVGGVRDIGAVERTLSVLVTTAIDEDDGNLTGDVSLREALLYGLADQTNQVVFDGGLDGAIIVVTNTLNMVGGSAFIDASALASGITLDGSASHRLLLVTSSATVSLHNVSFIRGTALSQGGAIKNNTSSLTLDRCRFMDNIVDTGGSDNKGGAIMCDEGWLTIDGCYFNNNSAIGGTERCQGGAIKISSGRVTIRTTTFESNVVSQSDFCNGGAIATTLADTLIADCVFTDNSAVGTNTSRGGAISVTGELLLRRSSLMGNQAAASFFGAQGGAVYSTHSATTIEDSTLSDNTASSSQGFGEGGGVHHAYGVHEGGALLMENCTLFNNHALLGAGLSLTNADAALRHLTISGHFAEGGGGGIRLSGSSGNNITMENCIIAGNTTVLPSNGADIDDDGASTIFTINGTHLIGDNTTVSNTFPVGPLVGTFGAEVDPLLDSLADYGGPTETMLLLVGSPAIDAGIVTDDTPFNDQRGLYRSRGAAPDLGAYETANETGYDIWTRERIPSGSDTNFTADIEPDQVVNGWEYGQRLDPTNSDSFFFTIGSTTPAEVTLDFPYRSQADDLVYRVDSTDDLCQPFTEAFRLDLSTYVATASASNVTFDIDPVAETITYTETVSGSNTQNFFRLVLQHILAP